jgi:hypothetical protein
MTFLAGTPCSGLDIKLYHDNQLIDPTSITYAITEPGGHTTASGSATQISTGYYRVPTADTYPSGYSETTNWTVTWTIVSPGGNSSTATETFLVVEDLTTSANLAVGHYSTVVESVKLDLGLTTEYTVAQYRRFIEKTLRRLNRRLRFTSSTTPAALSYDADTDIITPTPTDTIMDLIILQMECLVSKERRRDAVGKGIKVKDGDTAIDTTASFSGHSAVVNDFCGDCDQAIKEYLQHNVDNPADYGDIVWYGNRKIEADMTHDGEGSSATQTYVSPFENRVGLSVNI